jgi:hypothetical protein
MTPDSFMNVSVIERSFHSIWPDGQVRTCGFNAINAAFHAATARERRRISPFPDLLHVTAICG